MFIKNKKLDQNQNKMEKNIKINIRYDGTALKGHAIDIDVLGQSLTSLHRLMELASKIIYGHEKKINIKANANVEQNCFELLLEFAQNLASGNERTFSFMVDELGNILDSIGMRITNRSSGLVGKTGNDLSGRSLFDLIKFFKGKYIDEKQIISKEAKEVNVKGKDGKKVSIPRKVFDLYQSNEVKKTAQGVFSPLNREGIEKIEFKEAENSQIIEKEEVLDFLSRNMDKDVEVREPSTETKFITKDLVVHSPVLKSDAKHWSFLLDGKATSFNISNTDIAKDASERGAVGFGDTYTVNLEVQETEDSYGRKAKTYKIIEVLNFKKGLKTGELF